MRPIKASRFLRYTTAEISYLEPAVLRGEPRLRCVFTLRHAGTSGNSLNLSFDRGRRAEVLANRQRVLRALGLENAPLCTVRQVHGNQVCIVDEYTIQQGLQGVRADALVTAVPKIALGVLVADCLPIVLYTVEPAVLAVVHAGRQGTYQQVVVRALEVMQRRFAVTAEQVYAVFGPAIGDCCYALDARAVRPFQEHFPNWRLFFTPRGKDQWVMSLTTANEVQLREAGVSASHIQTAHLCTVCYNHYLYSHRAEGQEAGRGMGMAVLYSPVNDRERGERA